MKENFYKEFESNHRGSFNQISKRLSVYEPLLSAFFQAHKKANFVDLGCGRGEFLKLCKKIGIDSLGVDKNASLLAIANKENLNVINQDVISWLSQQDDYSFDIISSLHLIEHLSLESLIKLINEIDRVLKPGGLVILETPNPENFIVGSCNFFVDPTHVRPIPSDLLVFLFSKCKFSCSSIWRLKKEKLNESNITLMDAVTGVSPDYSLIGLKEEEVKKRDLSQVKKIIQTKHGYTLNELMGFYEKRFVNSYNEQKKQTNLLKDYLLDNLNEVTKKNHSFFNHIEKSMNKLELDQIRIETELKARHDELISIYNSTSWKVTRPLRAISAIFKRLQQIVKNFFFNYENNSLKDLFILYKLKLSNIFLRHKGKIYSIDQNLSTTKRVGIWTHKVGINKSRYLSFIENLSKKNKKN